MRATEGDSRLLLLVFCVLFFLSEEICGIKGPKLRPRVNRQLFRQGRGREPQPANEAVHCVNKFNFVLFDLFFRSGEI